MDSPRALEVLLVDDNRADVDLFCRDLRDINGSHRVHIAEDGVAALRFLRREGEFSKAPRPDIIVLDLNMPRMDGREVLDILRHDPRLSLIPVIVMTSSRAPSDVTDTYQLGANSYLAKPMELDEYCDLIRTVEEFW